MYTYTKKFKLSHNEMRQLLKDNNLHGNIFSKPKFAEILIKNNILKHEDIFNEVEQKIETNQERKLYLTINNPRKVKITDITTGEVREYSSLNRARKDSKIYIRPALFKDGVLYKERYRIKCV